MKHIAEVDRAVLISQINPFGVDQGIVLKRISFDFVSAPVG